MNDGTDYRAILAADTPLIDVRAPIEFTQGAMPAALNLPLPQPVVNSPSVMINLIGTDLNYDWLKLPLVHLHWYDKEVREGRKVGHLNLNDDDAGRLSATLEAMVPLLPPEYASGIAWAQSKLK